MFFESLKDLSIGELVDLYIVDDKNNDLFTPARVVRSESNRDGIALKYGIAVEFQNIPSETEKFLKKLI